MLISVHIPKTAGTSFRNALEQAYGDRLLQYYYENTAPPRFKYLAKITESASQFMKSRMYVKKYDVIHGHFHAHAFDFLPGLKQYAVFLRDPVDRLISHYLFWKGEYERRISVGETVPPNTLWEYTMKNKLSINEFAERPLMMKFYPMMLGKVEIDRFDFVGLQEEYKTSLLLFEKIFGVKLMEDHALVVDREYYTDILDTIDYPRVQASQRENQEVFEQARRRFDQLCARYL